MITWKEPMRPGDRHLAMSGIVRIGAVFPPLNTKKPSWRWRLFNSASESGFSISAFDEAPSLDEAKAALESHWADFLRRARLRPDD